MAETAISFDPSADPTPTNVARVMNHVLQKGFQAGSVLGMGLVAPWMAYKARSAPDFTPRLLSALFKTSITTTAICGALGVARLSSVEDLKEGAADRAYRLHYNATQNRVDRFSQVGMAVGGAAAAVLVGTSLPLVLGGATAGAAAGVVAHVATSKSSTAPSQMVEEIKAA